MTKSQTIQTTTIRTRTVPVAVHENDIKNKEPSKKHLKKNNKKNTTIIAKNNNKTKENCKEKKKKQDKEQN